MLIKALIIVAAIIVCILLYFAIYSLGNYILESSRKNAIKKWGMEERDYDHEKWMFGFYVKAFFIGIPILLIIALIQYFK